MERCEELVSGVLVGLPYERQKQRWCRLRRQKDPTFEDDGGCVVFYNDFFVFTSLSRRALAKDRRTRDVVSVCRFNAHILFETIL